MPKVGPKELARAARRIGREITAKEIEDRMRAEIDTGREDVDMKSLACLAGFYGFVMKEE
ncbi:hypothetical protein LCGC14_1430440 [marine sediment metagenome]|uniref:Uncharacterized protein n=1 Tax=marine sediment metagenome TaxID=412755 RepID=A0A0F9K9Y0_9ZZZZ